MRCFVFQAEDGIRYLVRSRGLGDVYKRQRFATATEIDDHFGCKPGYLGPIGMKQPVQVIADRTVAAMSDFVCGANDADFHYTCLLYTSDAADERSSVDLGGRRII